MTLRLTRSVAAALLLAGGVVHYDLWQGGYRHIPIIGPLFLANFFGAAALAAAALISRRRAVSLAGIVFAAGSLAALVLSRTVGIFGFTETIWTAPAIKAVLSEAGAITILGLDLVLQVRAAHGRCRPPGTALRARERRAETVPLEWSGTIPASRVAGSCCTSGVRQAWGPSHGRDSLTIEEE